jgi:hypothetical protein
MNALRSRKPRLVSTLVFVFLFTASNVAHGAGSGLGGAWGTRYRARPQAGASLLSHRHRGDAAVDWLKRWNEIAINASGLDHTPPEPGETRVFHEQLGPGRASRAIAIVHIAIFDAVNAIVGGYKSYTGLPAVRGEASRHAAIAQAAHDTLADLFPAQAASFDAELASDLLKIPHGPAKLNGIDLGRRAAVAILDMRADDGSQHAEPQVGTEFPTSDEPGKWRQDPISLIPLALGAFWGGVDPFVMKSGDQFRAPAPPPLSSKAYAVAFEEVKRLGGDALSTPTERTSEQTEIGIFWAYDGTPSLCAPPRLYNQIVVQIAEQKHSNFIELARLLALANMAMADAGIAIWESKYFYQYWRPVTGIRESDPGTGPTGKGDGNAKTISDINFSPLGAPASNLAGPNFTPPFPAYPSGHAGFGGALFQVLRKFYRTDKIPFTFVSDEFNGVTKDNQGMVRPLIPRTFSSFSQAEEENGQSRIYLGIHWAFDKTEGIAQGRRVADYVMKHVFAPVDRR